MLWVKTDEKEYSVSVPEDGRNDIDDDQEDDQSDIGNFLRLTVISTIMGVTDTDIIHTFTVVITRVSRAWNVAVDTRPAFNAVTSTTSIHYGE